MTPAKEKAEELYWKYFQLVADGSCPEENAKKCALIAIDELINDDVFFKSISETREHSKFWNEVQYELNKL